MKKTESIKTTENTDQANALLIAKKIASVMGNDFFTIDQMRKKMVIINSSNREGKLSWSEGRSYVTSIMKYGLAEEFKAVKDCYKIRLDNEFQLKYFRTQIKIRNEEIKIYKGLMDKICKRSIKRKQVKRTVKPVKK
ncbi:MAG: hypothetical protein A3F72_13305 [Bacteroidetes bacterium RIFCSPLOWO2_12_FULL_35_15]|nr:MAG: hypothetical protein A3F72_13305 [Bacteroidetes bacterium RIFCSPLOWO2_12_FULL_35_15]